MCVSVDVSVLCVTCICFLSPFSLLEQTRLLHVRVLVRVGVYVLSVVLVSVCCVRDRARVLYFVFVVGVYLISKRFYPVRRDEMRSYARTYRDWAWHLAAWRGMLWRVVGDERARAGLEQAWAFVHGQVHVFCRSWPPAVSCVGGTVL